MIIATFEISPPWVLIKAFFFSMKTSSSFMTFFIKRLHSETSRVVKQ